MRLRTHQTSHDKGPTRVREGSIRALVPGAIDVYNKMTAETVVWPETSKLRPGGVTKTRSNTIIARVGGI